MEAMEFDRRLRAVEITLAELVIQWKARERQEDRHKTQLPAWFGVAISLLMFLAMLFGFYLQVILAGSHP